MKRSRRLPVFNAAEFEQLSHRQKLQLLTDFIEALESGGKQPGREQPEESPPDSPVNAKQA